MGIDAEMFVRTKAKLSKDEVRELAYQLGSAFGSGNFWIFKDRGQGLPPRHCLEIVSEYTQDGPDIKPEKGETFIRVHPATRYYGEGYERGNITLLIAIAEWLERNVPGGEVWYGGDSSGVEAEKFDAKARKKMMDLFCKAGHHPYERAFDHDNGDGVKAPLCKFCWKKMRRYGWGAKYAAFHCSGCGEDIMTNDGGETFKKKLDDWTVACEGPAFSCPGCKKELVTRDAGQTFAFLDDAKKAAEAEKKRKEREKADRTKK